MPTDFFPDIIEIADAHGLEKSRYKGDRGWVRYHCPFCVENGLKADRNGKLYLHPVEKTFNCFRCGSKGGMIAFVALLEGKHEHDVTVQFQEEFRQRNRGNGKRTPRSKKGLETHPAMRLTTRQWKLMGYTGKVTYDDIRKDPILARKTLHWAWKEWQHFIQFKLSLVFVLNVLSKLLGDEAIFLQSAEEFEKELGIQGLLSKAEEVYHMPRRFWPKWARIAEGAGIEMYRFVKGIDERLSFTKMMELAQHFRDQQPYKLPDFPEHVQSMILAKEAV